MATHPSLAGVVYRAVLRLYPSRFHQDFAHDMALDFADASDMAWIERRWRGLIGVWGRAALDLAGSLTAQWMRTRLPIVVLVSISVAISTAVLAQTVAPRGPLLVNVPPNDRDLAILLLLTACVVLVIASTIIFTQWFLRPLLYRGSSRKRR
jgi:hypothetical protein